MLAVIVTAISPPLTHWSARARSSRSRWENAVESGFDIVKELSRLIVLNDCIEGGKVGIVRWSAKKEIGKISKYNNE